MAIPSKRPDCNADTVLPAIATAIAPSYNEGDAVPLSTDLTGKLRTDSTGSSGGGTEFNEDAAHVSGAAGTLLLAVRNDAGGTVFTSNDGDYSAIAVDNLGRVFITQTSIAPGTAAGHLGKAEDAAHASGDTGVFMLGVRNDAGTTTFGANGDYGPIATGAGGQVLTQELGRGAVIHFQASIPTTASGTALASNACKEATVKNLLSNSNIIWVGVSGVSASNGYELNPGEALTLKVSNTNLIYCLSASGSQTVCVIATN